MFIYVRHCNLRPSRPERWRTSTVLPLRRRCRCQRYARHAPIAGDPRIKSGKRCGVYAFAAKTLALRRRKGGVGEKGNAAGRDKRVRPLATQAKMAACAAAPGVKTPGGPQRRRWTLAVAHCKTRRALRMEVWRRVRREPFCCVRGNRAPGRPRAGGSVCLPSARRA